jgi:hypothetical protein
VKGLLYSLPAILEVQLASETVAGLLNKFGLSLHPYAHLICSNVFVDEVCTYALPQLGIKN